MNVKAYIPLVMALGLGLVAMVVARKVLNKGNAEPADSIPVVVAKRDVPAGTKLTAEDLHARRVAVDLAPANSFRDPKDLLDRVVVMPLAKGDAVVQPLLADDGAGSGVAALIERGYRAMTVEVNEVTGVAGLLVPGARVDVIAVVRDERTPVPMARTVLQNIKVTAVGRSLSAPAPGPDGVPPPPANNVTLMVTPKQAQVLQLVSQAGRPWLVLRNGRDDKSVAAEGVTLTDLRGPAEDEVKGAWFGLGKIARGLMDGADAAPVTPVGDAPTTRPAAAPRFADAPAAPRAAFRVVKVIRGGVESEVSVPLPSAGVGAEPTAPQTPVTPARPRDPFEGFITGGANEARPAN